MNLSNQFKIHSDRRRRVGLDAVPDFSARTTVHLWKPRAHGGAYLMA